MNFTLGHIPFLCNGKDPNTEHEQKKNKEIRDIHLSILATSRNSPSPSVTSAPLFNIFIYLYKYLALSTLI